METATLSTQGRLTIPARFRTALHLQPGDKVAFALKREKLVLAPTRATQARLVKGRNGRKVLVAPADSPLMTSKVVRAIAADFP